MFLLYNEVAAVICGCVMFRRIEEEVYQHLCKKGLVPEKQTTAPKLRVQYNEFRVKGHSIGTLNNKTLWKVLNIYR